MNWEGLTEWHYPQKFWCESGIPTLWWCYLFQVLLRHLWSDWTNRGCVMWWVGWLSVVWGVQVQMVWGRCCGVTMWERNLGINRKSLRVFSSPWGQGLCLNFEIWECFLSPSWHPGSIRRVPGSACCICLSNVWLLAEKTQVSGREGSIRYSSRSPSLVTHGMRLRSMR